VEAERRLRVNGLLRADVNESKAFRVASDGAFPLQEEGIVRCLQIRLFLYKSSKIGWQHG